MFESGARRSSGVRANLPSHTPISASAHQTEQHADVPVLSPEVRDALRYMSDNYAESVRLKDLARVTNRSPFQMIRAFRRELGITPHSWLIQFRVLLGTSLLKNGACIASVASEVGFADQTHFTRHFKRLHGETPGRFCQASSHVPDLPARRPIATGSCV